MKAVANTPYPFFHPSVRIEMNPSLRLRFPDHPSFRRISFSFPRMHAPRTLPRTLAACAMFIAGGALAAYPDRPITMIVPFPAGAGTDITARNFGKCLEQQMHASVVVMNRPGASGDIGLAALAQSAPDGYTLGIVNTPGVVSIPIERSTKYTYKSFDFLGNVAEAPGTISVHADSPIHTIQDLVAAAKAKPDVVTVGTQGVGSAGHISLLLLERAANIKLNMVPFQGASPARAALLGKVIDGTMANVDEAISFRIGAPWRILGVMSDSRSPISTELPTFKEAGYDIQAGSMRGFAGPKGMPPEVVGKLTAVIKTCVEDPDFRERAKKAYLPVRYLPPAEYVQSLQKLDANLRELWKVKPWNQ
jgi:tripartite-type tricarboxylate transporter receptor subunit TctC